MPISIPETKVSTPGIKEVNVAMIGADAYQTACKLKRPQVFAVSMRNLEYQAEKEARTETDPKTVHREIFLPGSGGSRWIRSINPVDRMSPSPVQI